MDTAPPVPTAVGVFATDGGVALAAVGTRRTAAVMAAPLRRSERNLRIRVIVPQIVGSD